MADMECSALALAGRPHHAISILRADPSELKFEHRTSAVCRFQVEQHPQNASGWDTLHVEEALALIKEKVSLPDLDAMICIMRKCRQAKDIHGAMCIHLHMCDCGLEAQDVLGNYLVPMFAECGNMPDAEQAFQRLDDRSEFAWTSLIQGFLECEEFRRTLELFEKMQRDGVHPSTFTVVSLLKACTRLKHGEDGKAVHLEIIKEGFEMEPFVGNSLVDMYAKCGLPLEARDVFNELPVRDVVSWTALIGGYAEQGLEEEAIRCLEAMKADGLFPNAVTLFCALKACGNIGALEEGCYIHTDIINAGFEDNASVGNTLVDMYAKCGSITEAQKVFDELPYPDLVSWTALISGYAELELVEEALGCFEQMKASGLFPDAVTFMSCLKACNGAGAVGSGQGIHMEIVAEGFEKSVLLGSSLVDMYAKFGLLAEAQDVLNDLQVRDTISWNALIGGYAEQGLGNEAINCLQKMQQDGLPLNPITFVCSLKGCGSIGNMESGLKLHDQAVKTGLESNGFIGNALVYMYAKCRLFSEAQKVFDCMLVRDTISYNTLITGFADHGLGEEALACWKQMQSEDAQPNAITFACSLKACGSIQDVRRGQELHLIIAKRGVEPETIVGNTLVDMYSKCDSLSEARSVFEKLMSRDAASWNTMITTYAEHGLGEEALKCQEQMQLDGFYPNVISYIGSLKAVISLGVIDKGLKLHAEIVQDDLETDLIVGNSLIDMYGKLGMLAEAQDVFDRLPDHDVISWSALISGYIEHRFYGVALGCLEIMQGEEVHPTGLLFARTLNACSGIAAIDKGREIYSYITCLALEKDAYVGTALVDLYAKCGKLTEARRIFDMLPDREAVAWTALIAGYSEHGFIQETLDCLVQMQRAGFTPDSVCFLSSLKACASTGATDKGRELHVEIAKEGLETDSYVGNTLVDMYAKGGLLAEAEDVFHDLKIQDVVSWTALITGYADSGLAEKALECLECMQARGVCPNEIPWNVVILSFAEREDNGEAFVLYLRMQEQGILPDSATYVSIFKACGETAAFEAGKRLHARTCKFATPVSHSAIMRTGLIDMYGKCGSMDNAQVLFDTEPCRDVVRWNALITGYARQEEQERVFSLSERMEQEGLQKNDITYISLLTLCSHAGLVERGQVLFEAMCENYGGGPMLKHQSCMVDLLGRAGRLDEALSMLDAMPARPDYVAWSIVLGACQKWRNTELGLFAFDGMLSMDEGESAAFALMSNMYSDTYVPNEDIRRMEMSEKAFTWGGVG